MSKIVWEEEFKKFIHMMERSDKEQTIKDQNILENYYNNKEGKDIENE